MGSLSGYGSLSISPIFGSVGGLCLHRAGHTVTLKNSSIDKATKILVDVVLAHDCRYHLYSAQ